jgi:hypothetical protein
MFEVKTSYYKREYQYFIEPCFKNKVMYFYYKGTRLKIQSAEFYNINKGTWDKSIRFSNFKHMGFAKKVKLVRNKYINTNYISIFI